jgi:hypothetical protein
MYPDPADSTLGGNLYSYNAFKRGGWFIPPSVPALTGNPDWESLMTVVGRPDLGENVWSYEAVGNAVANAQLALYDAVARTETYRWTADLGSLLNRFAQGNYSVSHDSLWQLDVLSNYAVPPPPANTSTRTYSGGVRVGHLYEVGDSSPRNLYLFPYSDKSSYVGGPFDGQLAPNTGTAYVDVTASYRDYPWCGGVFRRTTQEYDGSTYRAMNEYTYFVGQVTVTPAGELRYPAEGDWTAVYTYRTPLPSSSTTGSPTYNPRMRQFDSMAGGNNWTMQIQFPSYHDDPANETVPAPNPANYIRHHAVDYHSGQEMRRYVGKYDSDWQWLHGVDVGPVTSGGPFGGDPNGPLQNTRILNHDGRVFVYFRDWLTPPLEAGDPGVFRDPAKPFVLECWHNGSFDWKIELPYPTQNNPSLLAPLAKASKRWLLIGSQPSTPQVATRPGSGAFPTSVEKINSVSGTFWYLLRTDGQESATVGQLNYATSNPQKIKPPASVLLPLGISWPNTPDVHGPYDWVQDTDRLDLTLPDSATEFEDSIRATTD